MKSSAPPLHIAVLLTVRNESHYIQYCLRHLIDQGLFVCLIDNDSTDDTLQKAAEFLSSGKLRIEKLPYNGQFELSRILENEIRLSKGIKADWFIHHDADEIRYAPAGMGTLQEAISQVDKLGFNCINFNEFVFLPSESSDWTNTRYEDTIKHYYYFSPRAHHRLNAWKNTPTEIDLVTEAGHQVSFEGQKIFPTSFTLKHYIALSRRQLVKKYAGRVFSASELFERGWHGARASFSPTNINWPDTNQLTYADTLNALDTSRPQNTHPFLQANSKRTLTNIAQLKEQRTSAHSLLARVHEYAQTAGLLKNKTLPIPFVVGVMRSGTTLLRLMLDAHPDLAIPAETRFFPHIEAMMEKPLVSPKEFVDTLSAINTWPDFEIDADQLKNQLIEHDIRKPAEALRYFYNSYAKRHSKSRWGDKTPYYGLHLDQICSIFPEARFIHIIRDGRDVALSTQGLWFDLGKNIEETAANWVSRIRQTRQLAQLVPYYMEIRYEDLILQPEQTLRKVCKFIQLPYHKSMLEYHVNAKQRMDEFKPRYNNSGDVIVSQAQRQAAFSLANKPPSADRIGNWKTELPEHEIAIFEEIAGELLQELNYPINHTR